MTDYSEATSEELLAVGLAQLAEAQDSYNAMLVGNAWSPATVEGTPRDTMRGDAAKAHSEWLLRSADLHLRAALAVADMGYLGDADDDGDEDEDDDPPGN